MFDRTENVVKTYQIFATQLGAALGGYASLALKSNIISVFLICLVSGFIIGTIFGNIKEKKLSKN